MPIGIGLDHGHDTRARRAATDLLEVMSQRCRIQQRARWPAHLRIPVASVGVVFKTGVFPEEGQTDIADGAVTLLADNDIGGAFYRTVLVVNLVAVNEQNHVGVLLDSA